MNLKNHILNELSKYCENPDMIQNLKKYILKPLLNEIKHYIYILLIFSLIIFIILLYILYYQYKILNYLCI
jgi:hypothetical protein